MFKRIATSLLLRRLLKAHERQANSLEAIAGILAREFGGPAPVGEVYSPDDNDVSYSTDTDSWEREVKSQRKPYTESED